MNFENEFKYSSLISTAKPFSFSFEMKCNFGFMKDVEKLSLREMFMGGCGDDFNKLYANCVFDS